MAKLKSGKAAAPMILFALLASSPVHVGAEAEPVCFRHRVRGTILRNCLKVEGPAGLPPAFQCLDPLGKMREFEPGPRWEVIDGEDPDCWRWEMKGGEPMEGEGEGAEGRNGQGAGDE